MDINLIVESLLNHRITGVSNEGKYLDSLVQHHKLQLPQTTQTNNIQQLVANKKTSKIIKKLEKHRDHILDVSKDLI